MKGVPLALKTVIFLIVFFFCFALVLFYIFLYLKMITGKNINECDSIFL